MIQFDLMWFDVRNPIVAWTATYAAGWTQERTRGPVWVLSSPPNPSRRYEAVALFGTTLIALLIGLSVVRAVVVAESLFDSTVYPCASRSTVIYHGVLLYRRVVNAAQEERMKAFQAMLACPAGSIRVMRPDRQVRCVQCAQLFHVPPVLVATSDVT